MYKRFTNWLAGDGPKANIAISSRIRLARNISKIAFSHFASKDILNDILEIVNEAISKSEKLRECYKIKMEKLSVLDRQILMEGEVISPNFMRGYAKQTIISKDNTFNIMVNEEDHLRIQAIKPGLSLKMLWELVSMIDDEISKYINYAYSREWGYLTACLTNVGTGMRASVMLHLPALEMNKQLKLILQSMQQMGIAIRGFYGEGTEPLGDMYQISNQITLGKSEPEIIDGVIEISEKLILYEIEARNKLMAEQRSKLEDRIWRAYGILQHSRIITSKEAMQYLSKIRLGVDLSIIKNIDFKLLNRLMILIQPAHLQKLAKTEKDLSESERDGFRANLLKNYFK